jgi:hypothetical protein
MNTVIQIKKIETLMVVILLISFGMCFSSVALAQHHEKEPSEHVFKNQRKNIFMLSFGYTYVPVGSALHHHESDGIFVPSIGVDYKRRLSEKWALSLFTDWELDHYLLSDKEFSRDRAFIAVLGGSYEIGEGIGVFGGVGREFEGNHNLWVLRLGLECGFELGKRWIIVPSVFYDWKEFYSTYSLSIGVSYKF